MIVLQSVYLILHLQSFVMHNFYRGRSGSGNGREYRKPKIKTAERKKRKQQKKIEKIFPVWKRFFSWYGKATTVALVKISQHLKGKGGRA